MTVRKLSQPGTKKLGHRTRGQEIGVNGISLWHNGSATFWITSVNSLLARWETSGNKAQSFDSLTVISISSHER